MAKVLSLEEGWIILEDRGDGCVDLVVVVCDRAIYLHLYRYEVEALIDELSKLVRSKNEAH